MIVIKAQYSFEFIVVFAFSLAIIIPMVGFMNSEYNKNKQSLDESQAKQVLDQIAISAQSTYYSGYPSRTTLDLFFPAGIERIYSQNVTIDNIQKSELIFDMRSGNSIISYFPFRINASLVKTDGKRKILVKAEQGNYVKIIDAEN